MARLILWAILLVLLTAVAVATAARRDRRGGLYDAMTHPQRSVGLVRDPVCGVFVVPGQALTAGTGSATRYFCSEDCRRKWVKKR